jgi:hypothetical protein
MNHHSAIDHHPDESTPDRPTTRRHFVEPWENTREKKLPEPRWLPALARIAPRGSAYLQRTRIGE